MTSKSYIPLIGTVIVVSTFLLLQTHPIASLFHSHVVAGVDHAYTKQAIEVNEWLEGAFFPLRNVPISVLDLCGSILVCLRYREGLDGTKSWFESLVACTLLQFGGTTLTGLILGQTPSWIVSHSAFPALLLAWYLTFYCPSDLYFTLVGSKENKVCLSCELDKYLLFPTHFFPHLYDISSHTFFHSPGIVVHYWYFCGY